MNNVFLLSENGPHYANLQIIQVERDKLEHNG